MKSYSFDEFMDMIRMLRSEDGCPWDREQTHKSLIPCMREEAYEVIDAINRGDMLNLREELGDVLLQVAMHSVIGEEERQFTIGEVINEVSEKMVRRHPHVFNEIQVDTSEEVINNWDEIKRQEHKEESVGESMEHVPRALPANIRAEKILKKAAKAGIGPKSRDEALEAVKRSFDEFESMILDGMNDQIDIKYGDLLLQIVNLSRFLQLNAENSLTNATDKFINRFVSVERTTKSAEVDLKDLSVNKVKALWERAELE